MCPICMFHDRRVLVYQSPYGIANAGKADTFPVLAIRRLSTLPTVLNSRSQVSVEYRKLRAEC